MKTDQLKEVSNWLNSQVSVMQYGEIAITCVIHEGRLKRIVKTVSESELKN